MLPDFAIHDRVWLPRLRLSGRVIGYKADEHRPVIYRLKLIDLYDNITSVNATAPAHELEIWPPELEADEPEPPLSGGDTP